MGGLLGLQQQVGNRAVTTALQRRRRAVTVARVPDPAPAAAGDVSLTLAPFLPASLLPSAADLISALGSTLTARGAVKALIWAGLRDPNKLTNLVFWAQHPAAAGRKLGADEKVLAAAWVRLRDDTVLPALAGHDAEPGGGSKEPDAKGTGAKDPPPPPADSASLASSLAAKQKAGGMTVALYAGKAVGSHAEFKRQGEQFAKDHGAFGVAGGKLGEGVAMPLETSSSSLLAQTSRGAEQVLGAHPDLTDGHGAKVPVDELAIFTHGGKSGLNVIPNDGWISSKRVDVWFDSFAPYLSASPRVMLYACSTAGTPPKGVPFAEALRISIDKHLKVLHGDGPGVGSEVWGHQTVGHTTANRLLSVFKEGLGDAGTDLNGALGAKMALLAAQMADRTDLSEAAAAKLAKAGKEHMKAVLHAYRGKTGKSGTGTKDPLNMLAREAGNLGIERMWLGLTTTDPLDVSDLGLTEPARERLDQGFAEVRPRFQSRLAKLVQEAATVKG